MTNIRAKLGLLLVAACAVLLALSGCEEYPDYNVELKRTDPPSFIFSGRSPVTDFSIVDVPRPPHLDQINPFSYSGRTIWKISTRPERKGAEWPQVAYGTVPDGFVQAIPETGSAPPLMVGKLYVAEFSDGKGKHGIFFEMRNGLPFNVTDKTFGQ
jgi:hypothetical protein